MRYLSGNHNGVGLGGFTISTPDGPMINFGCYLPMPENMVPRPDAGANRQMVKTTKEKPDWIIPLIDQEYGGQYSQLWRIGFEKGKINPHQVWEFAMKKIINGRVCLLGDCAHMGSPRKVLELIMQCLMLSHLEKHIKRLIQIF